MPFEAQGKPRYKNGAEGKSACATGLWHNTGCHDRYYCYSAAQCESPVCSRRASRGDAEGIRLSVS